MAALTARLVIPAIARGPSTCCGPNWGQRMECTFCCWDVSPVPCKGHGKEVTCGLYSAGAA